LFFEVGDLLAELGYQFLALLLLLLLLTVTIT
jgi:hypothetical protein